MSLELVKTIFELLLSLVLAPMLFGLINKTKAFFAGRCGPPILQNYFDLLKLLHKGAVYSHSTTWIFRAGPVVNLVVTLAALTLIPFAKHPALISFGGDFVLLAYLLGLGRFFIVLAALDTASSFEGMGASREVKFSALVEPAFLLCLLTLLKQGSQGDVWSLGEGLNALQGAVWLKALPVYCFTILALFIVILAENSRLPFDDPNTHLELTMIHEVMVLDHSGPDLAIIEYASALKLWVMGTILVSSLVPCANLSFALNALVFLAGMGLLGILIGIVESCMARLRLIRISHLLTGATALAAFGALIAFSGLLS